MPAKITKIATVQKMLTRAQGVTMAQLQTATGWQPHSARAALTGLRKKGHAIVRTKNTKGVTVYRIQKETDQ